MKKTIVVVALLVCSFALNISPYPSLALDKSADLKIPDKQTDNTAKGFYKSGDSHLQAGDYKKAINEFTKALELNPRYADAYLGRGDAYSALENAKEAVRDYSEYLTLKPKDTFVYLKRAVAHSYAGDFQKAIEDLDKVLTEFPGEANLYYQRGTYYEALGKNQEAIDNYRKAAKLGYGIAEDELKSRGIK